MNHSIEQQIPGGVSFGSQFGNKVYFAGMRIIAVRTLEEVLGKVPAEETRNSNRRAWYAERKAEWEGPNDVKRQFLSVIVGNNNRFVFSHRGQISPNRRDEVRLQNRLYPLRGHPPRPHTIKWDARSI